MKVKELLSKLQNEHPDAEVTPCVDEHGQTMILVTPPGTTDGAITDHPEAVRILGGHAKRIERIRLEVAAFYGLPVGFRITTAPSQRDNVAFVVRSSTGEVMVQADLGIEYVVSKEPHGLQKNPTLHRQDFVRFIDNDPEMTGYHFWVRPAFPSTERTYGISVRRQDWLKSWPQRSPIRSRRRSAPGVGSGAAAKIGDSGLGLNSGRVIQRPR
jgi:hypothetical protein